MNPSDRPNDAPPTELHDIALALAEAGRDVQRTSCLPAATEAEARLTFLLGCLLGYFLKTGELSP